MPDVFGTPQDKAANTASRLGSRYNANTAWSSLDATPSWQLGGDRFAQYSQHLPRRGYSQINISVNPSDIEIDRTSVAPSRVDISSSSSLGPGEVMRMAQNFPSAMQDTVMNPIKKLAGKFMV
jgi:hypothetical protein